MPFLIKIVVGVPEIGKTEFNSPFSLSDNFDKSMYFISTPYLLITLFKVTLKLLQWLQVAEPINNTKLSLF